MSAEQQAEDQPQVGAVERDPGKIIRMAEAAGEIVGNGDISGDLLNIVKDQICKPRWRPASDAELAYFISVCRRTKLDPFGRQICAVFRKDDGHEKMSIQTTIDGFRVIAQRTGEWEGYAGLPQWCDSDGQWHEGVWLYRDRSPIAARVGVWRRGHREPAVGVAHLEMFKVSVSPMWKTGARDAHMLAKCAEALAFRRAFPQDLGGLYTEDETGAFDAQPAPHAGAAPESPVDAVVVPDPVELDEVIVAALERGVDAAGWEPARLANELTHLGVVDTSDPIAALSALGPDQATALSDKLNAAADLEAVAHAA